MDGNNLGNSIKTLRMAKGITQEELAYRINVSKDVLIKLARLFHVTTDNLLGVNDKQMIEVTGLTPRQQNTVWEIIEAYRAFNKANGIDETH